MASPNHPGWARLAETKASDASSEVYADLFDSDTEAGLVWWAQKLRSLAHALSYDVKPPSVPLQLVSGCTGSFAEGAVLKDGVLGLEKVSFVIGDGLGHNHSVCRSCRFLSFALLPASQRLASAASSRRTTRSRGSIPP